MSSESLEIRSALQKGLEARGSRAGVHGVPSKGILRVQVETLLKGLRPGHGGTSRRRAGSDEPSGEDRSRQRLEAWARLR